MPAKVVIAWVGVALSLGAGLYYANPALALLGTMAIRLITQVRHLGKRTASSNQAQGQRTASQAHKVLQQIIHFHHDKPLSLRVIQSRHSRETNSANSQG